MFGFVHSLIYLLDNRRVCLTNFWGAFILFDSREWRINKMKWGRIICIVSALRCQAFSWKNKDSLFAPSPLSPPLFAHFSGVLFARVKYYFIWLFAAWQCCLRLMKDPGPKKGWQWVGEREMKREGEREREGRLLERMSRFADPDNLNFPEWPRRHLTSAPHSDLCPRRSDPERTDRTAVGRQCSTVLGN